MRAGLLLAASLIFAVASPLAMAPVSAKSTTWCGGGIIGTSICADWWMKRAEHDALVAKARAGDAEAAGTLAMFHLQIGEGAISHRWAILAAERGQCMWIGQFSAEAKDRRDRKAARKWDRRFRWNSCGSRQAAVAM